MDKLKIKSEITGYIKIEKPLAPKRRHKPKIISIKSPNIVHNEEKKISNFKLN